MLVAEYSSTRVLEYLGSTRVQEVYQVEELILHDDEKRESNLLANLHFSGTTARMRKFAVTSGCPCATMVAPWGYFDPRSNVDPLTLLCVLLADIPRGLPGCSENHTHECPS